MPGPSSPSEAVSAHPPRPPGPASGPALQPGKTPRLRSLDVLRGATMLAMVLVNNPGSWTWVYPPLQHAEWTGCTPTDLIFPFFLFIMGVSMAFAGQSTRARVLRRTAIILSLGLLLNAFPYTDLAHARIPGVLQRLALCALLVTLLTRLAGLRTQAAVAAAALVGYGLLLREWGAISSAIPALAAQAVDSTPPSAMGLLGAKVMILPGDNPARALDHLVIGSEHLYRGAQTDPEGLLSTLPAAVTTLLGYWAGLSLRRRQAGPAPAAHWPGPLTCCIACGYNLHSLTPAAKPAGGGAIVCPECGRSNTRADDPGALAALTPLFAVAAALLAAGWIASGFIPLSKPLWTPSFTLWTGGWAAGALALCVLVIDRRGFGAWGWPFEVAGRNALLLFVGSGVVARVLSLIHVGGGAAGDPGLSVKEALYRFVFVRIAAGDVHLGSLLYACANVGLWWLVLLVLWRRRWFWVV